jgi:hypothetical protein
LHNRAVEAAYSGNLRLSHFLLDSILKIDPCANVQSAKDNCQEIYLEKLSIERSVTF